ncbi:MAG: hypothetical protein H0T89_28495, partial [Deltaproteobacteria bacterium]|nr:hypothetical protein [Deltaproteobacteria bacterium]
MRAVALILGVTACYSPAREGVCSVACTTECPSGLVCGGDGLCRATDELDCSSRPDAGDAGDAGVDVPPGERCFGHDSPPYLRVCLPPAFPLVESLELTGFTLVETDNDAACTLLVGPTSGEICVIAAESLAVQSGAVLRAKGVRPLMLLGASQLAIRGIVDVASRRGGGVGAGANPPGCKLTNAGQSTGGSVGASGGAGGSFQGAGGKGGASVVQLEGGAPDGAMTAATAFRGGCPGGAGGSTAQVGPKGAAGGGAVYVLTGGMLSFSGTINASGAGGNPAGTQQGGSGGGSGGLIVVESATQSIGTTATAFALGGGGSTGGGDTGGGTPGNEPTGPTSFA